MTNANKPYSILSATLALFAAGILCIAGGVPQVVGIESGSATFYSATNVSGIEVKGVSNALAARAEVAKNGDEMIVKHVDATLPVKSLATGMKMRDEHMRKYIFTTAAGQEPDLHFTAESASCPAPAAAQGFSCQLSGSLSIRGLDRPLTLSLKVKEQGSSSVFRVAGSGIVKLSDYGIEPPSQLGVKSSNEVEIHLDFTGKQKPSVNLVAAGGQ
jgi:polyisoprenoid-binding protein YceI